MDICLKKSRVGHTMCWLASHLVSCKAMSQGRLVPVGGIIGFYSLNTILPPAWIILTQQGMKVGIDIRN